MDIGSDVAETGAHRVLSLFAEILNSLLALLLLRVQALPEFIITLLARFLGGVEAITQKGHVRVQALTELLERLPYLLVVNL